MKRQISPLAPVATGPHRAARRGAEGKGARVAALTVRRYPLLSPPLVRGAMLACHAHLPLYLNVACLLDRARRDRLQVGRRRRCRALQRSAAPECAEAAGARCADLPS